MDNQSLNLKETNNQNSALNKTFKKCKNRREMAKICLKSEEGEEDLIKKAYNTNLISFIKVLLEIYKTLPKIISILDNIIEKRATTLIPTNTVYSDSYSQTLNQINKVINLTERKDKILNLYVIIEKIISSLSDEDRKIAILKFVQKNSCDDIARETNLAERTVFRRSNRILEKISVFMLGQNWDVEFLKNQIGNESWIYESVEQKINDDRYKKCKS